MNVRIDGRLKLRLIHHFQSLWEAVSTGDWTLLKRFYRLEPRTPFGGPLVRRTLMSALLVAGLPKGQILVSVQK